MSFMGGKLESVGETETNRVGVAVDFQLVVDEHQADKGDHRDTTAGIVGGESGSSPSADFSEGRSKQVHIHVVREAINLAPSHLP